MSEKRVIYHDNHLLILNKPAGLLSQPTSTQEPSIEEWGKRWLQDHYQKRGKVFLHAVHRLDKPASGVIVYARTSKALSRLQRAMREGLWRKEYWAVIEGGLPEKEGRLEHSLQKQDYRSLAVASGTLGARLSALSYQVSATASRYSLLRIHLETGRYHQIRAQLAAIGFPIVGDQKYGSTHELPFIALHHALCSIPHPITGEEICCRAEVPQQWASFLPSFAPLGKR
jgi:23S rRNA pseudouridine1911/1915/1917 synthase